MLYIFLRGCLTSVWEKKENDESLGCDCMDPCESSVMTCVVIASRMFLHFYQNLLAPKRIDLSFILPIKY